MTCDTCAAKHDNPSGLCTPCETKYGNWHPGYMARIVGFTITVATWTAAGCPRRDPQEVHEIFHTHCKPCWWYDAKLKVPGRVGGCRKCGCHVSADYRDTGNKITLPNAFCPLKEPKWVAIVQADLDSNLDSNNQTQE